MPRSSRSSTRSSSTLTSGRPRSRSSSSWPSTTSGQRPTRVSSYVLVLSRALIFPTLVLLIYTTFCSSTQPLTTRPGGPVDKPVAAVAKRLNIAPEQVLRQSHLSTHLTCPFPSLTVPLSPLTSSFAVAWVIAHSGIPITTSSRADRVKNYLAVPSIAHKLTKDEIAAIDAAGKKGELQQSRWVMVRKLAVGALVGTAVSQGVQWGMRAWGCGGW